MTSERGVWITLEGGDGSGKTTQADLLAEWLTGTGRAVVRTREPGGSEVGRLIRDIVLHHRGDIAPRAEALLYAADRAHHVSTVVRPALARGEVVLQDRYLDSSVAYQGAGHGFDAEVLSTLERWAQAGQGGNGDGLLQPDISLWFDLKPEVAAERLAGARLPDKFEAQPVEFFRRVAAGYAERATATRFARIDADCPREQVWQQVEAALRERGLLA